MNALSIFKFREGGYDAWGTQTVEAGVVDHPIPSPNASTLTYAVGTTRYLYNPITGGKAVLSTMTDGGRKQYSSDSRKLFFTTDENPTTRTGTLRVADTMTGMTTLIASNTYIDSWHLSANGDKVLHLGNYNSLNRTGDVTLSNADGSGSRVLATQRSMGYPEISSDQQFVALPTNVGSTQTLVIANLSTGASVEIADAAPVAWVRGSRRLVYVIPSGLLAGFWSVDVQ